MAPVTPQFKPQDGSIQFETELTHIPIGFIRSLVAIGFLAAFAPGVVGCVVMLLIRQSTHHPPPESPFWGPADIAFDSRPDHPYEAAESIRHFLWRMSVVFPGFMLGLLLLWSDCAKRYFRLLLGRRYLRPPA